MVISIMSKTLCEEYFKNGSLKLSTIDDISLKRDIYLIISSKRTLTPIATAFFNMCKQMYNLK
jgi:hypothetical protein